MGWLREAKRNILRRGSPAFRVGVWVAGAAGALIWIYVEERKKPINERVLFLPSRREVVMDKTEIESWNQRLSGGKLLSLGGEKNQQPQQQREEGVEAARARALAAIEKEAQREEAEAERKKQQHGWFSRLLGLSSSNSPAQEKQKKVSLLFDK